MDDPSELTAIQRAGRVTVRLLINGEQLTNQQIAQICGYADYRGAQYLMDMLSLELPIVYMAGVWRVLDRNI